MGQYHHSGPRLTRDAYVSRDENMIDAFAFNQNVVNL